MGRNGTIAPRRWQSLVPRWPVVRLPHGGRAPRRASVLVLALALAAPTVVSAAPTLTTTTFLSTGEVQDFTVPAGVSSLHVVAIGGGGGNGNGKSGGGLGGDAVRFTAELAVTPGATLYLYVGGNGGSSTSTTGASGGWNGGGAGGSGGVGIPNGGAGGGGGASDIRIGGQALTDRVLIAAGGGGGGGSMDGGTTGAAGGDAGWSNGASGGSTVNAGGGGGGTQVSGGSGGAGGWSCTTCAGALGLGGPGDRGYEGGGGGGAGVYGGGGGAASGGSPSGGAGGGGGSSYPATETALVTGISIASDTTRAPSISLTYSVPSTAPEAPVLSVSGTDNGQVTLAWTTPADGGEAITGYNVYQGTASGEEATTPVNPDLITDTTKTITGLTNGTTYWFTVEAVNTIGESAASNEVSATPVTLFTAPGAPIVAVTGAGSGWVALIWTPTTDGGSPITGYNIYQGTSSGGEGTTPVKAALSTDTTTTITGLTDRTTYWFTLKAVNAIGESAASNEISATPGPPCEGFWEFYQYYTSTPFTCTVSPGITSLTYLVVGGPGGNIYAGETITQPGGQGADIRGSLAVTAGETLTITVGRSGYLGGYSGAGGGGYSSISRMVDGVLTPVVIAGGGGGAGTGNGGPGGKAGLGGTGGGGAGGSDVHPTGYDGGTEPTGGAGGTGAYVGAGGAGGTYDPSDPTAANAHPGIYYGDYSRGYGGGGGSGFGGWGDPGGGGAAGTYAGGGGGGYAGGGGGAGLFYRGAGGGGGSSLIPVGATARTPIEGPQVKLYSAPGAPTMGTPVHGVSEVTLSWTPPISNGGSPVTGYNVYQGTTSGGEDSTPVNGKTTLIPGTSMTVKGLVNGTTYYFTVAAVTANGEGPMSNEVSDTPMTREPDAPVMHKPDAAAGQVTLHWSAPGFDGGEAITGYNVYKGTTRGGEETTPANATLITGTSTTVTGLANGTTYWFTVKAVNAIGVGAASNEVSAVAGPRYLYFRSGAGTIGRRELGGSNAVNNNFITGLGSDAPYGVAVDGQHVYWTVGATNYWSTSGWIGRADLDGTDVVNHWVPTGGSDWIAVDDDYIYWANSYNGIGCAVESAWGSIGRAKLDGSDVRQCWIRTWDYNTGTGGYNPQGVAVDESYVYWVTEWSNPDPEYPALMRARLDGTDVQRITQIAAVGEQPEGIALDRGHVYWAKACTNQVVGQGALGRSNLDGSGAIHSLFGPMPCPIGVAVNGPDLYFTNYATNQIGRLPTDGSSTTPTWLTGSISDWGIAVGPAAGVSGPTVPAAPVMDTPTSGDGSITLQWTAPASDGGSTITGYNVYQGTSAGHESTTPVNAALITGTTLEVDGLTTGATYWFTVKAVNEVGEGPASNEVSRATLLASTLAITGPASGAYGYSYAITVSGTSGTGALTFDAGSSTACSIDGPNVVIAASSGTCTITATRASDGTYLSASAEPFTLSVGPAPLTVTADAKTINYGEATPTFTVSYDGFVNGETPADLSGSLVYTFRGIGISPYGPSTTPPTEAGGYHIIPVGLSGDDYTLTFLNGIFRITQTETLTTSLTWNGSQPTAAYVGSPVTLAGLFSPTPPAANMTVMLRSYSLPDCTSAYTTKDTQPIATTGDVSLGFTPSADEIGTGGVRIYFGGGYSGGARYNVSYTSCLPLTVSVALIPTAISAVSGSGTYGGNATLTATLQAGDTPLSGQSIAFTLNGAPAGSTTTDENGVATLADVSVGTITGGTHAGYVGASFGGDATYAASAPMTGDLTVAPADQSISFTAPSDVHYGDDDSDLGATASSSLTVSSSSTTTGVCTIVSGQLHVVAAGICTVTASQAGNTNYNAAIPVEHTFSIGKAALTVTADADPTTASVDHFTKAYGAANPSFTVRHIGFVRSETAAVLGGTLAFDTTATSSSPVGAYDVTPKGLTSSNYEITFVAGTLDIGKTNQSITFTAPTDVHYGQTIVPNGSANSGLTVTYESLTTSVCTFASGGTYLPAGIFPLMVTPVGPQLRIVGVGDCTVRASQAGNGNYNAATSVERTFTAQKASLSVTADAAPATAEIDHFTKTYGVDLPTFTVLYAGFVNGDDETDLGGTLDFDTTATASSDVGSYDVTPNGLTSSNYEISFVAGTLDIGQADQATLSITGPESVTFGHADYDITISGGSGDGAVTFAAGSSTGCSIASGKLHVVSGSGTCSITATRAADTNYKARTSAAYPVTLQKADQAALSITGPASVTFGHADYDITTSGGSGDGDVTFDAGSSTGCSIASGKLHVESGTGTCAITATKAADTNYKSTTSTAYPVTLQKANQSITFDALPSVEYGSDDFGVSATAGSGLTVSFSASGQCTIVGTTVHLTASGSCTITASQAGNDDYNSAVNVARTFSIGVTTGTVAYIGQTFVVTSGPNSSSAQVTLSASVVGAAGDITNARVTFIDDLTHVALAKGVKVSPVPGSTIPTGTANVVVNLGAGKYGAQSYLIRVVLDTAAGSSYENTAQLADPTSEAYPTITVMVPGGTNTAKGDADLTPLAPAGTYGTGTDIHYTIGLKYNKGGSNPQGQIVLGFDFGGYRYYVKSNSISSIACTKNATPCRDLTIYTKASIYKVDGMGLTTSVDGNVTLRVDLHDEGLGASGDTIGFTVLSSKNGTLYYSNNWKYASTAKAWRTVQQAVNAPDGLAVQIN